MSEIKLLQGDCLELMNNISDKSVDMILTDPPYGTTDCGWDFVLPFDKMWEEINRVIKDNGAIVLFGSEPFSSRLRMSNIKNYKYDWVWNKHNAGNILIAKFQPLKITENVMVFSSGGTCNYYPILTETNENRAGESGKIKINKEHAYGTIKSGRYIRGDNIKGTQRYPKNILDFSNACHKDKCHPTQKPVALLKYLIETYTKENETVLDFTMGSGSTGVACKLTNRNFIGIELDENYFKIAEQRINNGFVQKDLDEDLLNSLPLFLE
jgi:site-specific DNA-methyltransferase (adenine-specific)